jgi:hypothetical protein
LKDEFIGTLWHTFLDHSDEKLYFKDEIKENKSKAIEKSKTSKQSNKASKPQRSR